MSEGDYLFGEEEATVVSIPARLHGVLLGPRAKAYVGREDGRETSLTEDKSHLCADCGASMTITGSLANTADVVEKSVIMDMAESGKEMRSTHSCMKIYFIKNRSGETILFPASQSTQPLARSGGWTNPLRHRRLCTDFPSRAASHTRTAGPWNQSCP